MTTQQAKPILYILLNGPPYSGKSTIARELTRELGNGLDSPKVAAQDSFAAPTKHFIAAALGEKYQEMDKDKQRPELNGYSVRQTLIDLSQSYLKRIYGADVFARWLVHRSLRYPTNKPLYYIVDDLGFTEELGPPQNYLVVHVHRSNYSFKGDSRRYIFPPDERRLIRLDNNGLSVDLWIKCKQLAQRIKAYAESSSQTRLG